MLSGHVFIATSLDGYIAKSDGDIEWLLQRDDPQEDHGYLAFIKNIDGIVMGRNTFEKSLSFGAWPYELPVVVLSRTLQASSLREDLKQKVQISSLSPQDLMPLLSAKGWRRAYIDGGQVIQSFLRAGLIDDMTITTVPVLLGEGKPLFAHLDREIDLKHTHSHFFPSGLVQSHYQIRRTTL